MRLENELAEAYGGGSGGGSRQVRVLFLSFSLSFRISLSKHLDPNPNPNPKLPTPRIQRPDRVSLDIEGGASSLSEAETDFKKDTFVHPRVLQLWSWCHTRVPPPVIGKTALVTQKDGQGALFIRLSHVCCCIAVHRHCFPFSPGKSRISSMNAESSGWRKRRRGHEN